MLVLTMPAPKPVALMGDLLATQAKAQGVAAVLVDAVVRDVDELRELGLPVWARYIRARADPTRTWWASSTSRSLGLTFASTTCG